MRSISQRGFSLMNGHGFHDVAADGGDDREDHDCEDDAGGEHADAEVRLDEKARPAEVFFEDGTGLVADDGHKNEDCPETVDDAGDRGQKLGEEGDGSAQRAGTDFQQEDGDAE